jgi:hypothetical protein
MPSVLLCDPVNRPRPPLVGREAMTRDSDPSPARLPALLETSQIMWLRWVARMDSDTLRSPKVTFGERLPRTCMT